MTRRSNPLPTARWRKSTRSNGTGNGNCVEVACLHDAAWRKSTHSNGNGGSACLEVAPVAAAIALRDSKLATTGDFPHLIVPVTEWAGLLAAVESDR
ncbi:uncharacterized protein DUF397 [Stackebrandtia albiflava]|uniref:Uncharacterized protein DUF397 n=1 Tax=Stackebrandtia albiflava TaxID=406432 RepID=A0A562UYX0_9ACTN|nr:DUF397 domain-containing protein [Stackebrandtia albiflava]TWJ10809.1 uncharacterized protein DUF397 [Stackebrandtia albiflava]